jgi:small subunit ribosomal protein S11
MANTTALRAFRFLQPSICASCRTTTAQLPRRFSTTPRSLVDPIEKASTGKELDNLLQAVGGNIGSSFARANPSNPFPSLIPSAGELPEYKNLARQEWEEEDRHHLHVYAHKHNTHITLSKPNRDSLISVSCGNIGFKKAGRGTYDAAYQLAAFVMSRVQDKGLLPQIEKLEVIYRGFGPGREAVTKAILGSEGKRIRPLIVKLSDSTRLKFGGTRSKKPRRLG